MKIRTSLCLIVLISLALGVFHISTRVRGAQQNRRHRTIARLPIERNEPVRMRVVKVNGAKVLHRQKFLEDDEWLSGLTVTIKNMTEKTITFAAIDLQFPRLPGSEGPTAIHTMQYGNRALLTQRGATDERSPRIAPGQSVDMSLTRHDINGIEFLLSATGYRPSGPEKLNLSVGHVIFEDETMWYGGTHRRRDPNDSTTWVTVEQSGKSDLRNGRPLRSSTGNAKAYGRSESGLTDRSTLTFSFGQLPGMKSFFSPVSHNSPSPVACHDLGPTAFPGCGVYRWCGTECRVRQDSLTTSPGNYFLGQGAELCESAACINEQGNQPCTTYRYTSIKIL